AAVLLGRSIGQALRAATLALHAVRAAFRPSEDHPWAPGDEWHAATLRFLAGDEPALRWYARLGRLSASPGGTMALAKMTRDVGVRHVLPAVCVPTLVLDSRDDPVVPGAAGRHIAERTPGAKVVELPGRDHLPWIGDTELVIAEMRELLTGGRHEVELGRDVRAGLHTGECEVRGDDVRGIAVHICARVADQAAGGEILVSSTVRDLVAGSGIAFEPRGTPTLKGVPGEWQVFSARV